MSIVAALDKVLFFNASSKYSVLRMKTEDSSVPTEARSPYRYHDHLIRFTAVGIELPQTDTVKIEMDGEWKDGKYGLQLQVDHWQEIVPPTLEGVRNYLASGLLKGIGEKTADAIIEKFGVNALEILEHQPDRLLEIRGITKERLAEIKDAYAETSRMRVLMTLLAPFKVTPTTAQKIYQHFGPACADIVRQSPFNLCQVPGFGFKRIDAIVQKSGGDLRDPKRVHGALFYALEDARTKDGHLYKNTDIGTYVDYSLMVAEYTNGVSGKEVYNKVGKTAMDKYDVAAYVDGNDASKTVLPNVAKDNKDDLTGTDTGVLTQVFVNDDEKEAVVTEINTYLGIADSDYSAKKDEADFTVYGLKKSGKVHVMDKADDGKSYVSFKVSGEDFDVSKVEEDDAVLFTVAAGEVQTFVPAETIKDTEITSFKKGSNVTVGGTKYEFNAAAYFDAKALKVYTGENNNDTINLKDTTYNVYLDTYGNLIGLEEVDAIDNYVFITGADANTSNLATKTTDANAIFLDGTSKVIEVSKTKGNGFDNTTISPVINKWFTYTVDKNGVYTLKDINDTYAKGDKVGQSKKQAGDIEIDKKHVSLDGSGIFTKVYGNADSIYLTASLKKVVTDDGNFAVISGVDNVTTGVKNASIKTWNANQAMKDVDSKWDHLIWAANGVSNGVYTLFKDNGYVIAAVVVGDDAASTKNLVFSHKKDVELESYDKTEDEWTWTRKVVNAKGEEIVLTEKSDSLSELNKMVKGMWYQVKYDAKGNVISVEPASTALSDVKKEYITSFTNIETAVNDNDTVLLEMVETKTVHNALDKKLTLKGSTLYDATSAKLGVAVDDDTNIVFIQKNDNKETTSFETGVKALETALKNLNEVSKDTYSYEFSAYIEDGIATTVVIRDLTAGEYEGSKPATKADYTFDGLTAYVDPATGAIKFSTATCDEISDWDLGLPATVEYTISVNGGAARTYKQTLNKVVKMYDSANDLKTVMTVPGLTVKNGSNLEINVMVTFKGTGTDTNTYTVSGTCYIA